MSDDLNNKKKHWLYLLIPLVTLIVGVPAVLFPSQIWNFLRGKGEQLGVLTPAVPDDDDGEEPQVAPYVPPVTETTPRSEAAPDSGETPQASDVPQESSPASESMTEETLTLAAAEQRLAELAGELSDHPVWRLCLAQDKPLVRLVRLCDDLANGSRSLASLDFLRQPQPFAAARTADGRLVISQATRERYAPAVQMFTALPALPVAKLYLLLESALQEACESLGYHGVHVRTIVTAAANQILVIPQADTEPSLVQQGPGKYCWENPQLEQLTPAQKLLLRLGQENLRLVRNKVEEIGMAIGLWEE